MCGIAGCWNDSSTKQHIKAVSKMLLTIAHRGPDNSGVWNDMSGVVLGHRRLSILDLSIAGAQPMISRSKQFVLTYNGEIYNYVQIQKELEKAGVLSFWQGSSDTEILLAALSYWGVEKTLLKLNGMFAFAFWDREKKILTIARDRFGIKPLYYGWTKNGLIFSSELRPIAQNNDFDPILSQEALSHYLRFGDVPAPFSIYKNVKKLLPGSFITFRNPKDLGIEKFFWSARQNIEIAKKNQFSGSENDAANKLESILTKAVKNRMIADVSLGAFLSGGIDSSLIVSLMQKHKSTPIKTFTIGFDEKKYNEANFAAKIARHLRTDHTELIVNGEKALNLVPSLSSYYDEPFADSSQIPTLLLSRLTRKHVTVALSGDGGDEHFAGYIRHNRDSKHFKFIQQFPFYIRSFVAKVILSQDELAWNKFLKHIKKFRGYQLTGAHPRKFAELLNLKTIDDLYLYSRSAWNRPNKVLFQQTQTSFRLTPPPKNLSIREQIMYQDLMTFLPNDVLTKVDRASMSVGLEVRVPLLDHNVMEFAWSLPESFKFRNGKSKWILRKVLYKHVPSALIERPKAGFSVPIEKWLRGPLKDWGENLLDQRKLKLEGIFKPFTIKKTWEDMQNGTRQGRAIWTILMLQSWLDKMPFRI